MNVNRCNKCQEYGHIAQNCKNGYYCAFCNGENDTRSCSKSPEFNPVCANCVRANKSNHSHRADSSECPCYIAEHGKRKNNFLNSLN